MDKPARHALRLVCRCRPPRPRAGCGSAAGLLPKPSRRGRASAEARESDQRLFRLRRLTSGMPSEELLVEQMARSHVAERREQTAAKVGVFALELREQHLHALPLQVLLRPAQITRDDGEALFAGEG